MLASTFIYDAISSVLAVYVYIAHIYYFLFVCDKKCLAFSNDSVNVVKGTTMMMAALSWQRKCTKMIYTCDLL